MWLVCLMTATLIHIIENISYHFHYQFQIWIFFFFFFAVPGSNVEAITKQVKEEDDRIENMVGKYLEQLKQRNVSFLIGYFL